MQHSNRSTLTKADIVESIHRKLGFSKKEGTLVTEKIFATLKEVLEKGNSVKISGFGKFSVRSKKERRGRNPQTGDAIQITARKVLSFKPSKLLRNLLADSRS